jgi:signal transduction histidine kinase
VHAWFYAGKRPQFVLAALFVPRHYIICGVKPPGRPLSRAARVMMRKPFLASISLARKCQILFGAAVLSIIAAALIIPGKRMNDLTRQRFVGVAKEAATLALETTDTSKEWNVANEELKKNWPRVSRYGEGEFSQPPQLVTMAELQLRNAAGQRGFLTETAAQLQTDRKALYRFSFEKDAEGRDEVRLAMAVRDADSGALRGLIDVRVPINPESQLLNQGVLIASLCCAALLALLVFYLITQKLLLSPVRKLRRMAEQVTSGDIAVRSAIATGDEYEDLAIAFNDMLGHLQSSQEELRKINLSLDTRLGELAETNVSLFESNKLKSEFIANVSHELRTPLVSIIGFAELLVEFGDRPPSDVTRLRRYAGNILTSGRMLLDLINDLLDLAKIEAGKLELHVLDFELTPLCTALIDFFAPLADKSKLSLTLQAPEELPRMSSDAGRLKQILYNLLSNAIKFTSPGGAVALVVEADDEGFVTFSVADTGPGIPPDKQAVIFEKFHQLDSSVTREYSGTGLGLAITRELGAMLGGVVTLDSAVGKGSIFSVRLPTMIGEELRMPLINLT